MNVEKSYEKHENWYLDVDKYLRRITVKDSIDYWRHNRMFNFLEPFTDDKKKNWLTIGDGIGSDAHWLLNKGLNVIASDIAYNVLQVAHDKGYIKEYLKINAEKIELNDSSIDYILCKEAYHHFPRPYIALYEMIRVSRKAVILIEPNDIGIVYPPIIFLKNILDKINNHLINKVWKNRFSFETVGNFVYKTSEREIEKMAMGINLPSAAFKGFVDFHIPQISDRKITEKRPMQKMKVKIWLKSLLCKIGIIPYPIIITVMFKEKPDIQTQLLMKKIGYKYIEYPINPYI